MIAQPNTMSPPCFSRRDARSNVPHVLPERSTRTIRSIWETLRFTASACTFRANPGKAADLLDGRDDLNKLGNDGAAYYSLVLSGCRRDEEARRILSMVDRETLLPEVRMSLDRAFGALPSNAVTHQPD